MSTCKGEGCTHPDHKLVESQVDATPVKPKTKMNRAHRRKLMKQFGLFKKPKVF